MCPILTISKYLNKVNKVTSLSLCWLAVIGCQRYLQAFKCRIKLQISPLRLEGSKSSPSFLLAATINSLIEPFKFFWWYFLDLSRFIFGSQKLVQQTNISLCFRKGVVFFCFSLLDKLVDRFV